MPEMERMADFFDRRAEEYDVHMLDELGLEPFYAEIGDLTPGGKGLRVLDLGCGTGLELERLLKKNPDAAVTAVDISGGMLDRLQRRLGEGRNRLTLVQASYWEMPLPAEAYDLVLSTYSLHHASPSEKLTLYRRIYETLAKGGRFLYGDYVLPDYAQEEEARREGERIRKAHGLRSLREVHVDIPLSMETERDLLRRAGFPRVTTAWEGVNAAIFEADKAAL